MTYSDDGNADPVSVGPRAQECDLPTANRRRSTAQSALLPNFLPRPNGSSYNTVPGNALRRHLARIRIGQRAAAVRAVRFGFPSISLFCGTVPAVAAVAVYAGGTVRESAGIVGRPWHGCTRRRTGTQAVRESPLDVELNRIAVRDTRLCASTP